MSRLHQILAVVVSSLLVVLVAEGGLRLLGFGPAPTINAFDPTLGWRMKPSASIRRHTSEFDVRVATNSRGIRDDESVGYAKHPGTTRILMVGDSFTLGYTVARPDTIPDLLERALRSEGRAAEVVNGGTEGYSTDQEVLWLASEGASYSPDVVVLQMYENDIFWNSQERYLRYPKPLLLGPKRTAVEPRDATAPGGAGAGHETQGAASVSGVEVLDAALARAGKLVDPGREPWLQRHSALGALFIGLLRPQALPMTAGPNAIPTEWLVRVQDEAPGWRETQVALAAFRAAAERLHAKPLVLVIPDKAQIDPRARDAIAGVIRDPGYDPERPYRGMIERARAIGLPVVDPEKALLQAAQAAGPLYYMHDWHTTVLGNRVLASELDRALAATDFLGPPPHPSVPVEVEELPGAARALSWLLGALLIWLVLGTLYRSANPAEGVLRSYASVAALVAAMALVFAAVNSGLGLLPVWLAGAVSRLVLIALLVVIVWYLRHRIPVMAELFACFVRRGQWYTLPVLVGLLSIGGLLIVAASSPWLAPFIYTLF